MNKNIKDNIIVAIESLVAESEAGIDFLNNRNMDNFDISKLPTTISKMLKLASTQAPEFSNVAIITTATFELAHMYGQLRPIINDPAYSQDAITPNFYAIIIAPSGASKDLTHRTLLKVVSKGLKYAAELKETEENEKALATYIRKMTKENPTFDESTVKPEDYLDLYKPKVDLISDLESSRGGIAKDLNNLSRGTYGISSIFESELGMAIQSSSSASEVLTLYSKLFDMGCATSAKFKTAEAQEQSITGMFPNFLGISSPTPFYQTDGAVRKILVPAMETALARRIVIIFSSMKEDYENMHIPQSLAEERIIAAKAGKIVSELTAELQDTLLTTIKNVAVDNTISMDEESAAIYRDYKSYTKRLGQLMTLKHGESVESLEISGRAWKCLRVAALWSLAEDSRIIRKETLISAIYFIDYTAQHLTRFSNAMKLKPYELFIRDWKAGIFTNDTLPIDKAIDSGYIISVTASAIQTFLKPVNSKLEGVATVTYNEVLNSFIFTPIVQNTSDEYSYSAVKDHVKDGLKEYMNKPIEVFEKLLSNKCTINPFVGDTTKVVILQVSKSFLSMQTVNKYLSNIIHFIATTNDIDDNHTFILALPLNIEITREEYKYISTSIATQLMLRIEPADCESTKLSYCYSNSTCLSGNDTAILYDISGLKGQHASGNAVSLLSTKIVPKQTAAQIAKYYTNDIEANQAVIIDMLNISSTKLLLFAGIIYDLHMHNVSESTIETFIDTINASLEESISQEDKIEYLINPFKEV